MSAVLGRKGVIIFEKDVINTIGAENYVKMKKTFTKTIRLPYNKYKSARMVHIDIHNGQKLLRISRFLAFQYLKKGYLTSIRNNLPRGDEIVIGHFACNPYPIQITVHNYIMQNYFTPEMRDAGSSGLICELEAGLGKTFLAATIINSIKLKTLYVVPSEYLLEQAIDDLSKCFPDISIGRYYGKKKTDGDIVVAIINSMLSDEYILNGKKVKPAAFFSRFGLAIFDEVHEYNTVERSKAFTNINSLYMLGITAEANNREDKMDFIGHYNVGPVLYSDKIPGFDVPDDDRYKASVQIVRYGGSPKYTENLVNDSTGMMQTSKMTRQILQDPHRMQLIVDYSKELYSAGHNFFIWCDMREAVYIISDILRQLDIFEDIMAPENDVAYLMGGTSKEDIVRAQNARIIVATYQYAYRGCVIASL